MALGNYKIDGKFMEERHMKAYAIVKRKEQ